MKYLTQLKYLASKSDHHQHKLGCIILNKNRIVAQGFNKVKTSPKSNNKYNMIHAELDALRKLRNRAEGYTALVYRSTRGGALALSKPCVSCHLALKQAGIKKVIYTTETTFKEERL